MQSLGYQKASGNEDDHTRHGSGQSKESLGSGVWQLGLKQQQLRRIEQPGEGEGEGEGERERGREGERERGREERGEREGRREGGREGAALFSLSR